MIQAIFSYCYEMYFRFPNSLKFTFHFQNSEFTLPIKSVFLRITPTNSLSFSKKICTYLNLRLFLKRNRRLKWPQKLNHRILICKAVCNGTTVLLSRPVLSDFLPVFTWFLSCRDNRIYKLWLMVNKVKFARHAKYDEEWTEGKQTISANLLYRTATELQKRDYIMTHTSPYQSVV